MRFCFFVATLASSTVAVMANGAPDALMPHIRSVVRVDSSTHKLVRIFQPVRPPETQPARDPDPAVKQLVDQAAKSYDVNPLLVHSVISVESNFDPYAVSPKGAMGLMQLMPGTARRFGVSNAFDPKQNIEAGVRYLRFLQDTFGDDALAVAAYNAGERAVEKYNGIPPYAETKEYVKKVGARYGKARRQAAAQSGPPAASATEAGVEKHPPVQMFYDEQGRVHLVAR